MNRSQKTKNRRMDGMDGKRRPKKIESGEKANETMFCIERLVSGWSWRRRSSVEKEEEQEEKE